MGQADNIGYVSLGIAEFTNIYPPAGPHIAAATADQNRLLTEKDGVFFLAGYPFPSRSLEARESPRGVISG